MSDTTKNVIPYKPMTFNDGVKYHKQAMGKAIEAALRSGQKGEKHYESVVFAYLNELAFADLDGIAGDEEIGERVSYAMMVLGKKLDL